jgi:hypothetical protein
VSRSITLLGIAGLIAATPTWPQAAPSGFQSQVRFAGHVTLVQEGKRQPIAVSERTWFIRPGATVDDLRAGGEGSLLIEIRTGALTTIIDGRKQARRLGEFFVVAVGQKLTIVTADRSAIVRTILMPPKL